MSKLDIRIQPTRGYRVRGFGILIVLLLIVGLTLWQATPPSPKPVDAPATDFSAERAFKTIEDIAQRPHPTGSAENTRVRQYLIDQLKSMGLTPETDSGIAYAGYNFPSAASVTNVVARLKGTDSSKAILLMAHYDSVATGPGASDDGVGVATELETLRALINGPPQKNDVIFLFTDGEELGSLGAQVFWNQHPWAQDVGVVLNFEARGSSGASLMFQTSEQNGWLIEQFAQSGTHPVSNSFMGDLYRRLPNDTDLTVSNEKQFSGMNFAFGGNWPAYHTVMDNVENVNLATLQHHGENALKLVEQLGNADLTNTKAPDASYFNMFGLLVHYPQSWVVPIAAMVALLFVAVLLFGLGKSCLSMKKISIGLLVQLLVIIVTLVVVFGLWKAVEALWAGNMYAPAGGMYDQILYEIAFVTLTLAITVLLMNHFQKRLGLLNMLGSGLLLWTLLMLTASVFFPGGSYMFTWPLLISVIAFGFALNRNDPEAAIKQPVSLLVTMLPVVFFLTSILSLIYIFMPVMINVYAMVLVVLGLQLLLPQLSVCVDSGKWWLPSTAALTTAVLLIISAFTAHPSSERPVGNNISYYLNTDTNQSVWVSWSDHTDKYLEQFLPNPQKQTVDQALPIGLPHMKVLTDTAPAAPLPAPDVQLQEAQEGMDGKRKISLMVTSKRQGSKFLFQIPDPSVEQIAFNGTSFRRTNYTLPWNIEYYLTSDSPLALEVTSNSTNKIKVIVSDVKDDLPVIPEQSFMPRPEIFMPEMFYDQSTIVSKTFEF
ncbi:M28 family peptidase [Paenibacillus tengchongensis]|uniref:M28 family peptidase n=1 Tax=Paenibacillus tengchongensis TaxID=2608684 RepID=UPI00124C99A4|nr:M28 family peptidase [Paenibacillus tengchongensis]